MLTARLPFRMAAGSGGLLSTGVGISQSLGEHADDVGER